MRTENLVRFFGYQLLAAVEWHCGEKLSVGQLRHPLVRSIDARVLLDVVVPRRNVGVAERPIDRNSFLRVRLEIEIAVAVALASPHQRPSTDVVAAIPVEALRLGVRRLLLVDPPVGVLLVELAGALEDGIAPNQILRAATSVSVLPRPLRGVRVVLDVLDVPAALEQQDR